MALYPLNVGDLPQISDVNQLTDMFNGKHDTGAVTFAPQLSAPPISGVSATAQAGTLLGVGPYNYQITAITGYYKTNGTLQKTGETPVSSAVAVTTTSGNQAVKITLPTTGLPISQVAWGIYRTAVSGSTYGLVASVKVGNASYTDTTADGSRGAVPPTVNTTGTTLSLGGNSVSAVVAKGSNVNGDYIRYDNGLQICWLRGQGITNQYAWSTTTIMSGLTYYWSTYLWTYPAAFLPNTTIAMFASGDIPGSYPETHNCYIQDWSSANTEDGILGPNATTISTTMNHQWMAIGWWK